MVHRRQSHVPSKLLYSVLMIGTLIIQGCATLERSACPTQEWKSRGYAAAVAGKDMNRRDMHGADCTVYPGSPAWEAYRSGYAAGLRDFCRPDALFELGRQGDAYPAQCLAEQGDLLQTAYGYGRDIYELDRQIGQLQRLLSVKETALQRAENELTALRQVLEDRQTKAHEGTGGLHHLEIQETRVNDLLSEFERLNSDLKSRQNQRKRLVSVFQ